MSLWLAFCPSTKPALHAGPVTAYTNRNGPCGTRFPLQNCTHLSLPVIQYIQTSTQAERSSCPNAALCLATCSLASSVCTGLQNRCSVSSRVKTTNTMLQGFTSTQGHAFSSWGTSITVWGHIWLSQQSMEASTSVHLQWLIRISTNTKVSCFPIFLFMLCSQFRWQHTSPLNCKD